MHDELISRTFSAHTLWGKRQHILANVQFFFLLKMDYLSADPYPECCRCFFLVICNLFLLNYRTILHSIHLLLLLSSFYDFLHKKSSLKDVIIDTINTLSNLIIKNHTYRTWNNYFILLLYIMHVILKVDLSSHNQ